MARFVRAIQFSFRIPAASKWMACMKRAVTIWVRKT
jgi:hypothetical protein